MSELTTETEQEVMQAVGALKMEKTMIIIAHRLRTVEDCDRLYQLDNGRLIQEDTSKKTLFSK